MIALPKRIHISDSAMHRPLPWRGLPSDYRLLVVALSFAYGLFLATRPLLDFKDRQNYLNYFLAGDRLYERSLDEGTVSFLSNEPIWLLIARAGHQFMEPEVALRVLVGVPAAVVAFVVLRFGPRDFFWIMLFLLIPIVIKNHVIHLRQGLAVAMFLVAYFLIRRPKLRFLIICLCPFIHSSFFFIVVLVLISRLMRSPKINVVYSIFFVFIACGLLAFSLPKLIALSSARQASFTATDSDSLSGLGFLFWLSILFLVFSSGAESIRKAAFPVTLLVFYTATYFLFGYAGRVLESGILVVLLSLLNLPSFGRKASLCAVSILFLLTWAARLGSPGLGWGLG